jgi:glycosyltransferase involved in cell wall biosynthesis
MKKIVYIANIRMPTEKAHGVQIMKTCEAMANKGMDVTLIVTSRKTDIKEDPFKYYNVKNNFRIKYAFCPELISLGKFGFFIMNIIFSQTSSLIVFKIKPDIIYSRDYFIIFDLFLLKCKKVWEVHDGIYNPIIGFMRVSGIVAISNGLKDFYSKKGFKNIVVAHDAVDLSEFESSSVANLSLPGDRKIIMYIGHLYGWKGLDTFIKASSIVSEAQFVVIGGTAKEVDYLKNKNKNVIFLGYRPYNELSQNQKVADILVVPNSAKSDISRLYTSPLKVFSYMTSGVPIVASDLPSIREILNDNNAFFAIPDNAESFADKIRYVLSHPDEARKRSITAKRDIVRYTWDSRVRTILDFFDII